MVLVQALSHWARAYTKSVTYVARSTEAAWFAGHASHTPHTPHCHVPHLPVLPRRPLSYRLDRPHIIKTGLRMCNQLCLQPQPSKTEISAKWLGVSISIIPRVAGASCCSRWTPQTTFPILLSPSRRPNRHSINTDQTFLPASFHRSVAVSGSPSVPAACTPTRCTPARVTQLYADVPRLPSLFPLFLLFSFLALLPIPFSGYRPATGLYYILQVHLLTHIL